MLGLILFLLAAVGHTAFLVACMNCLYGYPIPRKFLKRGRFVTGVLILAGPVAFLFLYGIDVADVVQHAESGGVFASAVLAWLGVSWVTAGLILPTVTLLRWFQSRPKAIIEERSETVDVAKLLGEPPLGHSKHGFLARLPGNDCFRVEFTTLELCLPGWPAAWDGATVLHISDLHLSGTPDRPFYEAVFERCMADGMPDLLTLTGDVVDSFTHHRWILPLLSRLRWRDAAFAILGNHDFWYDARKIRRRLVRLGFTMLANTWTRIEWRDLPLTVAGHEGPWNSEKVDLSGCPADGFRLLLSHTPDNLPWARRHGFGLMLSGHNHGGQIRVPGLGSIFVPSRFSRRYDMGTFASGPTLLHVNRGLAGREPIRWFCRPQITRLRLRSTPSPAAVAER